jgi:hypothetical protein
MGLWGLFLVIFAAGVIGGLLNALMTDNGFVMPRAEDAGSGVTIYRPGFLGNALIGAVAACISWGLYGPAATAYLVGGGSTPGAAASGVTVAAFTGAILVGVGGARWLTNEVDKRLLRAAASQAANKPPNADLARQLSMATPVQALKLVRS